MFIRNDDYTETDINTNITVNVVKADVNAFLKQMAQNNEDRQSNNEVLFDVIICDPPKLAPKKTFLKKAMKR
jgi:23S rRNA G2069 N7-methylase RlmK/C1962 C5-methylase RlmI